MEGFPGGTSGKEPACQCRRCKRCNLILHREDPLVKSMTTHSSIFTWRTPCTEEPVRLQTIGKSQTGLKRLSMHAIIME